MAKLLKLRRGTTTQHGSFTGAEGEVTIDTTKDTAVVHDGSTAGGTPLAKEDMSNVSSASIAGRLSNDSIATSKIAAGALPSDVTIASANIVNGSIAQADMGSSSVGTSQLAAGAVTNDKVNSSAAIAGTKISPDFGSQNIVTTGTLDSGSIDITNTLPKISLVDTNNNDDFDIKNQNGTFIIADATDSADRLTIASNGEFNLYGNVSTSGELSISSDVPKLFFTDTGNNPDYVVKNQNGAFTIQDTTNSVSRFTINTNGHIDINDNLDCLSGVDVTGNITATGSISAGEGVNITSTSTGQKIEITKDGTSAAVLGHIGTGNEGFLALKDGGSNTVVLNGESGSGNSYINSTNFGLGTATPSQKLDVVGNIAVSGTVDGRDVASDGSKLDGIESGATADQSNAEIRAAVEAASDSNVFTDADHTKLNGIEASATADQTAAEIRTLVESASDSNVFTDADHSKLNGIESGATADQTGSEIAVSVRGEALGTSSDGVHDVYNDGWFRSNVSGNGLYNQSTTQHFYSDNDDYWNIAGGGSANGLRFRDDHAGTVRGYVYSNNSNQIGFLNSSASWSLQCDNSGNVTATGNVTAYSDARLKTNVNTINDALSIVGKLRGVSFDWKESGKRSIGVIAQEVEKVLPELVLTQQVLDPTGESEIKSVDYGKIVGVLINAINELKEEVEELKNAKITG